MASVQFYTESEFQQGAPVDPLGPRYLSVSIVDSNKFVVAYQDRDNDNEGVAKIGTVSGTDITFGAQENFELNVGASYISVSTLDTDKFVVVYRDARSSDYGFAKIGTINGTTIAFGASNEFSNSNTVRWNSVATLSPTKFVVSYLSEVNPSGQGVVKIGTVDGTTITFGNEAKYLIDGSPRYNSIAALSSTKFVIAYQDWTGNGHGVVKIGTVNGTDVIFGASTKFVDSGSVSYVSVAVLSDTKFIVAYRDEADSGHGTAKIGTVSGTSVTFGEEIEFLNNGDVANVSVTTFPPANFIVVYKDGRDSDHGTAKAGTVSGTDIVLGNENEFLSTGSAEYMSTATLDSMRFVVVYTDVPDSFHGTAKIGALRGVPIDCISSGNLFINGFEQKPSLACPALSTTSSIVIKNSLIAIYQSRIDALINQLGKNVYLEFDPIRNPCPNCTYDIIRKRSTGIYVAEGPRPFARGRRCPYCKGKGLIETAVNKCIKCLIKWNAKDAKNFGIVLSQRKGVVRLKTFITEADDIIRAKTILVNHDIIDKIQLRVKLIKGPIPVGLREDRYCISFLELL